VIDRAGGLWADFVDFMLFSCHIAAIRAADTRRTEAMGMRVRLFHLAAMIAGLVPAMASAQPGQLPLTGFTLGGTGLTPFYVLGFELGPWQHYLAQELTPSYMLEFDEPPVHGSWLDMESVLILPAFAEELIGRPVSRLQIQVEWQSAQSLRPATPAFDTAAPKLGFERGMLTPGVSHNYQDNGVFGVSAVFAYQSFGVAQLGKRAYNHDVPGFLRPVEFSPYQETGYGAGVRLAVHQEVLPGMAVNAGFQSRIDMEEFASFNGVYSHPADLDIPARASVGLALQAGKRSWVNVSVEHVMYSSIDAFPSRLLPDRFLSLLGDSTSPEFSWDDLTVYSVGWSWSNGDDVQWRFDISSRSQPLPTSAALSRALSPSMASNAVLLGYSKRTGINSRFDLNAAYAPAEYAFGGSVLGVITEDLDQSVELEASWTLDF